MIKSLLKTEKEYDRALERLNEVFDVPENTPEGQEAELLSLLSQILTLPIETLAQEYDLVQPSYAEK